MDLQTGGSIFAMLANATLVVKLVLALLVAMSLTSWSIIIYKFVTLLRARKRAQEDLVAFMRADTLGTAVQWLKRDPGSPLNPICTQGIDELQRLEKADQQLGAKGRLPAEFALKNIEKALQQAISYELSRLSASMTFLATCANATPFIGLFGTVWGIMNSFHAIGQMQTATLATVAPGISEALIATAIGLAVAVPASMAYNTFLGLIAGIEVEFAKFGDAFLNWIRREIPVAREQGRANGV